MFARWADKEGVSDAALLAAMDEISRGLIDANLGGHVFKKRVGIGGRGKSGGVRTLLALRVGDRAFFVFGFAKNERSNVSDKELETLKRLASQSRTNAVEIHVRSQVIPAFMYGAIDRPSREHNLPIIITSVH